MRRVLDLTGCRGAILCTLLVVGATYSNVYASDQPEFYEWLERSSLGDSYGEFAAEHDWYFGEFDANTARYCAARHPGKDAYLLLMHLYFEYHDVYVRVPRATRAAILAAGLRNNRYKNDWGSLNGRSRRNGDASMALVGCGPACIKHLLPLLSDKSAAQHYGSDDATNSIVHRFRVCDYAHRCLSLVAGEAYLLYDDLKDRDHAISSLRRRICTAPGGPPSRFPRRGVCGRRTAAF